MKDIRLSGMALVLLVVVVSAFTLHGVTLGQSTWPQVRQQYPGGQLTKAAPRSEPLAQTLGVTMVYHSADQRFQFWFNKTGVLVGVVEIPKAKITREEIQRQYPGINFEAEAGSLCLNAEVGLAPGIFKCIKIEPDGRTVSAITVGILPSRP